MQQLCDEAIRSPDTDSFIQMPANNANQQWTCTVCNRTMHPNSRQSHESSKKHTKKEHTGKLPKSHHLDDDDLRSLLYDIDTQWGLLPHGGAYKESNHY